MSKSVEDMLWDVVDLCDSLKIDYAIMGGLAVRVHGIPRPTYDVDVQLSMPKVEPERSWKDFLNASELRGYEIPENYRSGWRDQVGGMPLVKLRAGSKKILPLILICSSTKLHFRIRSFLDDCNFP